MSKELELLSEQSMKLKGEERVWKSIFVKSGATKLVSQTQLGQQLIITDATRVTPIMRTWIEEGCSKIDRKKLKLYFSDDEFLMKKIVEIFLLLSSTSHIEKFCPEKVHVRHKDIHKIQSKIFEELTFDQTWRFVENLIDVSEYFEVEQQVIKREHVFLTSLKYTCLLSDSIMEQLAIKAHEAFFSEPITVPPKDWSWDEETGLIGGYHHYSFEMVRTKSHKVDYSKYSQNIFDAVNYIQSTPWRVNKTVVEMLKRDLKHPVKEDFIVNEYPESEDCEWGVDLTQLEEGSQKVLDIKAARKRHFELAELYAGDKKDFESAVGKYRAVRLAVGIAERYAEEEVLYFPHSYDFRGRVYPIPIGLSPQGADGVKAMLEYANGEILTEKGEAWAWAYLATLYGDDKLQFDERVKRGKELLDADYMEADEPYQFYVHQQELREFIINPKMEFKGRVHLDACNSGSQFTSAMTNDVAGCRATNVIPTVMENGEQNRQDAYLLVADKALDLTKKLAMTDDEEDIYKAFQTLLETNGRKLCKTPVMVSNYGGTAGGRTTILFDVMRELKVDRKYLNKKTCTAYSKVIGDSISGVLNGSKAFESYIQKMNGILTKSNKPIIWETSDGFNVVHVKKKELKPIAISCFLPGSRRATTIIQKKFSSDINPTKMKSAIAPNYVHSIDAQLLRTVALRMEEFEIASSDFIHDSFGCHPNHVDTMMQILREEFYRLVMEQPLQLLDAQLRYQITDSKMIKLADAVSVPSMGEIDLAQVLKSDWFFS